MIFTYFSNSHPSLSIDQPHLVIMHISMWGPLKATLSFFCFFFIFSVIDKEAIAHKINPSDVEISNPSTSRERKASIHRRKKSPVYAVKASARI